MTHTATKSHDFQFDPVAHRYRLDGVVIPGISFILERTGFVDKTWFKPEHADRGHAVHAACLYLVQGDLDWASVAESIRPRVEGFKAFLDQYRPDVILAEAPLYSATYRFAGTPDLVLDWGLGAFVVDIKTGKAGLAAKLQTAAQKILVQEKGIPAEKRFALELPAAGGFKLIPHQDAADHSMFLNALAMVNRRINEKELSI